MKPNKRYDVAISFAGEDRKHAEVLANALKCRSVAVFYDRYEKATLWGTNLYTHLFDLYQNQARYCVMLLSQHYAKKMWTKHELEAAQARAFQEHESYILSVRLDNTEIPGILPAYSPNLNLIERLWKWVKKKCLYSKYYATSEDFQQAIQECIAQAHSKHQAELKSLLTLEFQTFKEVPVIGEGGKVTPFPGAKQPQKKVSSKAARSIYNVQITQRLENHIDRSFPRIDPSVFGVQNQRPQTQHELATRFVIAIGVDTLFLARAAKEAVAGLGH